MALPAGAHPGESEQRLRGYRDMAQRILALDNRSESFQQIHKVA